MFRIFTHRNKVLIASVCLSVFWGSGCSTDSNSVPSVSDGRPETSPSSTEDSLPTPSPVVNNRRNHGGSNKVHVFMDDVQKSPGITWSVTGLEWESSSVVDGDILVASDIYSAFVVDLQDGSKVWSVDSVTEGGLRAFALPGTETVLIRDFGGEDNMSVQGIRLVNAASGEVTGELLPEEAVSINPVGKNVGLTVESGLFSVVAPTDPRTLLWSEQLPSEGTIFTKVKAISDDLVEIRYPVENAIEEKLKFRSLVRFGADGSTPVWAADAEWFNATYTFVDDVIIVLQEYGTEPTLTALNAAGEVLWTSPNTRPIAVGGKLYLEDYFPRDEDSDTEEPDVVPETVRRVDPASGDVMSEITFEEGYDRLSVMPKGHFVADLGSTTVQILDENLRAVRDIELPDEVHETFVGKDLLYFRHPIQDGYQTLTAVDPRSGQILWDYTIETLESFRQYGETLLIRGYGDDGDTVEGLGVVESDDTVMRPDSVSGTPPGWSPCPQPYWASRAEEAVAARCGEELWVSFNGQDPEGLPLVDGNCALTFDDSIMICADGNEIFSMNNDDANASIRAWHEVVEYWTAP